jgi:bifunctional ADP-heptose synthase (sugar kinase/adenylyltransferase)
LRGEAAPADLDQAILGATELARQNGHGVFVTLAEQGILAALPDGTAIHVAAHSLRGEIDIVGAGDSVTAALAAALAAGGSPLESLELASAAASVVIHQLGTTGTASVAQIAEVLGNQGGTL